MKRFLIIGELGLLLLTGCERCCPKLIKSVALGNIPTAVTIGKAKSSGTLVFIAAGQSNMVGQDPTPYAAVPRLTVVGGDLKGPSIPFAEELLAQTPSINEIIVIRCAVNSTHIGQWKKGNGLYDACMNSVQALGRPEAQVAGFLFWQGEADAKDPNYFKWASEFQTIIKDFRLDWQDQSLPVIFCQLATTTDPLRTHWQDVKNLQASIHGGNVAMIKTDDQPLLSDGIHVSAIGDSAIGIRMAQAYGEME